MIDPVRPDFTNTPVSSQRPSFGYRLVEPQAPPCVTIITPFYNTGEIFYETARSVLQQSFQQWEWLIINDGSTNPEAIAILARYREGDPRVRVIDLLANAGPSAARNRGFQEATAPYVLLLDSDNLLEPTAAEKWLWFLESYSEFSFVKGYSVGFGAREYLWREGFHRGDVFLEENQVDMTSVIRKAVHTAAGGYDETIRDGLEDWDFWLRCADHGYWGGTLPEYLDWYRRRASHNDRWANWDDAERQQSFRARLRQRYPRLWKQGIPRIQLRHHQPLDTVSQDAPWRNALGKNKPRLLLLIPWMTCGGADKFNLDVVEQFTRRGWEVSIAATLPGDSSWLPRFARLTPDIFILPHFLRLVDYPRFLRYLVHSRQTDVVLISNSELGYLLLPYLRAYCPDVVFLDFCHIEEEYWKNGGYPRMAVEYQELLDLNVVSSAHLKEWMADKGADPQRIRVCFTNIDADRWRPDPEQRATVRHELKIEEDVPVILYTGRICAQKQPRVFAEAVLRLVQKELPFIALVAGDGPDLEWLRSFVEKQGISDRVRLLGTVSNERVGELMGAADIFFLPSLWEGISLSIFEAMACGLPVVGADVGGQRELVTPECGALLTRSDELDEAERYAEALALLLQNREQRHKMGHAGRQRVEGYFRLEQMGERMASLVDEAVRLHSSQPRPTPGPGVGRACAVQVVEHLRLVAVNDWLWKEREQRTAVASLPGMGMPPSGGRWRTAAYFALRRRFLPYYESALKRDVKWLLSLKNRIKRTLLRGESL
jgi:glycosyltransferase involved in cell wall biosynthesis